MNSKVNACRTTCCVHACKLVRHKNPNLSFHNFPNPGKQKVEIQNAYGNVEVIDRRKAWILKLKIAKKVTKYMKVCSSHFTSQDYYYADWVGHHRRLLLNAVPSQNLPNYQTKQPRLKKNAVPSQKIPKGSTVEKHNIEFVATPDYPSSNYEFETEVSDELEDVKFNVEDLEDVKFNVEDVKFTVEDVKFNVEDVKFKLEDLHNSIDIKEEVDTEN